MEDWAILLGMSFEGMILNLNMKKLVLTVCAVGLAGGACAATDTSSLAVSATVQKVCAIGSGALSFATLQLGVNPGAGTVTGVNHDFDTGSSISVVCTNGATAAVTAGLGSNPASTTAGRQMKSGSDMLSYELYTTTGRTTVLDASAGAITYTGTGATSAVTVYGRVSAAQLALAKKGSYSDTVAMTVTYTP